MPKKITVTLSEKSEKYFNEVAYSLDSGDGKVATNSDVINWALGALSDFEDNAGEDLLSWLKTNYPHLEMFNTDNL